MSEVKYIGKVEVVRMGDGEILYYCENNKDAIKIANSKYIPINKIKYFSNVDRYIVITCK